MGKRMKDVYPHATKWQVFKYKTGIVTMKVFKTLVLAAFVYGSFKAGQFSTGMTYAKETVVLDNLPKKIESLKEEVLETLKSCESKTHTESDGLIILDTNNEFSIGLYQFQIKTVQHYYQTLYGKTITRKEAVEIALNEAKARELAQDIIFKTDGGYRNWLNCSNSKGLVPTIATIKKLEN